MALSETKICNLALAKVGSKRINDIDTDTTPEAIWCRTFYEQTRDALLRSNSWSFAKARATLSEDASAPDFEYDNQFDLPADFMRLVSLYNTWSTFKIEGEKLLTDDSSAEIVYVKKVTDPTKFDALFVEALVLQLAIKLSMAISQDKVLSKELKDEFRELIRTVRTVTRQETNTIGRNSMSTWISAYSFNRDASKINSYFE